LNGKRGESLLRISLLGRFFIQHDRFRGPVKLTHTARALLAYLLVYRHRIHARDVLAGVFWEDFPQKRARNCLNTTIWRLRRFLEPRGVVPGTYLISTPMGELGFNVESDYWLDVDIFEKQILAILTVPLEKIRREEISLLEETTRLYLGDLLEGFYGDWALRERERLRCRYLDCLYVLMRFFSQSGEIPKALEYGQKILETDPLREDVHRHMMQLYGSQGQRSLAVRQYHFCCNALRTDLGIPPMPETQALYRRMTAAEGAFQADLRPSTLELDEAISKLHSAMETVALAQQNLEQVLEIIHRPASR
jgi:DNA-binding SARP family transcriptional activator